MDIFKGIQNFLQLINENWVSFTFVIGLAIIIGLNIKSYISKSNEEKIAIAKKQVKQIILKLVTKAELNYKQWSKSGEIKRSQVIDNIYSQFPILSKVANQDELLQWIDDIIAGALETMNKVLAENTDVGKTDKKN